MSSRLLRRGTPVEAVPLQWRPASGTAAATAGNEARATADLEMEMEARARQAYQQGYVAGGAEAARQSAARLEPVMARFQAIVDELARLRGRHRAELEQETVKLAIAIARRILHREMATDPEAILGLVKAAFDKLNAREIHRLRLTPADAQLLEEQRARLSLPPAVQVVADGSLESGAVLFETTRGQLDASISTQLAEIDRGFTDLMSRT